ncbi:hypothetical protein ColTof4_04954 [Colletotrichum tofieldiae]|nr:hypothetical protein ColTof3_10798 [Colletotrichum tofieldiae]GKT72531.1 hypothetical protein ColTof4_04954 [Colletotrichum tofieldiae]
MSAQQDFPSVAAAAAAAMRDLPTTRWPQLQHYASWLSQGSSVLNNPATHTDAVPMVSVLERPPPYSTPQYCLPRDHQRAFLHVSSSIPRPYRFPPFQQPHHHGQGICHLSITAIPPA